MNNYTEDNKQEVDGSIMIYHFVVNRYYCISHFHGNRFGSCRGLQDSIDTFNDFFEGFLKVFETHLFGAC